MESHAVESEARRRRMRMGIILGAALILLVLLLLILGPLLVPTERLRAAAESTGTDALERPVEIGGLHVRLLPPSLRLHDVRIGPRSEAETQAPIEVEFVTARLTPFPLLFGRIEIPSIVVEGGELRVERLPDGTFAAADLLDLPEPEEPLWDLGMGRVVFRRTSIHLVDRHVVPGETVVTSAGDVRGDIVLGTVGEPVSIDLEMALFNHPTRNLEISGRLPRAVPEDAPDIVAAVSDEEGSEEEAGADHGEMDLRLRGHEVATAPLLHYLGDLGALLPAEVDLDLAISGELTEVLEIDARLGLAPETVLAVSGQLDSREEPPRAEMEVMLDPVDLGLLISAVPPLEQTLPPPVAADGVIELRARLAGSLDDLRVAGWMQSEGFGIRAGSFNGGTEASGGLLLESDELLATIEGRLRRDASPRIEIEARSTRLVLDYDTAEEPPEDPPELPDAAVSAHLRLDSGRALLLDFEDLDAYLTMEQGRLTLRHRLRAHEGSISGRIDSDLRRRPSSHRMELELGDVDAGSLARDTLEDVEPPVTGSLSVEMVAGWRGVDFEEFQESAEGEGVVSLIGGRITTLDLEPDIAEALREVAETIGVLPPEEFTEPTLRDLSGTFTISDGFVYSEVMDVRGTYTRILVGGGLGMDRSLDLAGTFAFSSEAADRFGPIGQVLRGPDGWLAVPFSIAGTVEDPDVSIDVGALIERAVEGLVDEPDARWEEMRRLWREHGAGAAGGG